MKKILNIFSILSILSGFVFTPMSVLAYSNSGHAWYKGNPTYVEVTIDPSVPSTWITAIANSEATWNNAGARFRFTAGSSQGHTIALKNVWWMPNALAVTYTREIFTNTIKDRDTDISSRYLWDTNGSLSSNDVQNIMTHEFGHWFMLDDLYAQTDLWKTMYGSAWPGRTDQRTLEQDDINGIKAIYP